MNVVICGSMRFEARLRDLGRRLEALGHRAIVPAPTPVGIDPERVGLDALVRLKSAWMAAHLDAIRHGDAVLVANFDAPPVAGYVGSSALVELACGFALGKPIYLLQALGEQPCRLEVLAMGPVVLAGDVTALAPSA